MTSTPTALPRRRPRNRKTEIRDAAAELFSTGGFTAVGLDQISAAVGITAPAIYRHFSSKADLLRDVIFSIVEAFAALEHDPDDLEGMLSSVVDVALNDPAYVMTYLNSRALLDPDGRERLGQMENAIYLRWVETLRATVPDLTEEQVLVRLSGTIAMLGTISEVQGMYNHDLLARLLVHGARAVHTTPAATEPRHAAPAGDWRPPRTRRQQILDAAIPLFGERGFHAVSIDEIGEAAGLSGPAAYRYIDGKVELLVDALEQVAMELTVGVRHAIASATSAEDALGRLIDSYADIAMRNIGLMRVYRIEAIHLPGDPMARIHRWRHENRESWCAVLAAIRPDLDQDGVQLLTRLAFALIERTVAFTRSLGEVSAITQRLLTMRP